MEELQKTPGEEIYRQRRLRMIERQLKARGIHDSAVLEAMTVVPRHAFVPAELRDQAYEDRALPVASGQTISQPYIVAIMTQLLALQPTDTVLEIGTGTGYQTAILANIARHVVSIERYESLALAANKHLEQLGYENVILMYGDGTLGSTAHAPFDAVLVTAAAPSIPLRLRDQLSEGGRLVCPVGSRDIQHLVKVVRRGDGFVEEETIPCVFVPLIGKEGWPE